MNTVAHILIMSVLIINPQGNFVHTSVTSGVFESKRSCMAVMKGVAPAVHLSIKEKEEGKGNKFVNTFWKCAPMPPYITDDQVFESY